MTAVRSVFGIFMAIAICTSIGTSKVAAFGHGEAEHEEHPNTSYCDDCDCCTEFFLPCGLAHGYVCSLSGKTCSLHTGNCSNQGDPGEG